MIPCVSVEILDAGIRLSNCVEIDRKIQLSIAPESKEQVAEGQAKIIKIEDIKERSPVRLRAM